MPFDGSGNFSPAASPNFPAIGGEVISAGYYNNVINDLTSGLSNALTRDGQGKPLVDLNWNGKSLTNANNLGAVTGTFTGNGSFGGTLSVTGVTTLAAVGATNATLSGTLGVTGNTTLGGTLGVTGNTSIGGTLGVTGAANFGGSLTAGNIAGVNGTFTGTVFFSNTGFVFSSDGSQDTGMRWISDGVFAARSNGSDVLTIGGAQALAVTGAMTVSGAVTNSSITNLRGTVYLGTTGVGSIGADTTVNYYRHSNHSIQNAAGTVTYLTIDSSGNVGIGTAPTANRLQVSGDVGASNFRIGTQLTSDAGTFGFTNGNGPGIVVWGSASGGAGKLDLNVGGNTRLSVNTSGGITSSDLADAVGYKGLPQNQRTSAYTLTLSDMGKHVYTTAGAFAVTVPANSTTAFPVGTAITIINEDSVKTITPAGGVTLVLAGIGSTGTRTLAIGAVATLIKVQTGRWYISGVGIT